MVESRWQKVLGYVVLVLFLVVILLPFYWMVITSFKPTAEVAAYPPTAWPQRFTWEHYVNAFTVHHFGIYIRNSIVVTCLTTVIVVILSSMAGFALARLPVRGKTPTLVFLLIISMFPAIAIVTPLYMFMRGLGWLNTYQALIIPYTAFNLPFAIWIMRNYFLQVPAALLEAAKMDGASIWQTFWRIYVPLTTPGLFTAAVFTFVASWTEFFMALVFNSSDTMRTIPVGIALFSSEFNVPYGDIFAGSIVSILPIVVLVILFRRWIVSGLTAGAVKG
ncbi:MAG: carbohydrate ABC transporter permease [Thermoflavifilum sp.]|nr:carbohydrate ABC transporter permease [Thermoflavifilum sp.]MCL6513783.1 carbohydrate ABC transporter permease [Alicyclobacillus sp.]